MSPSSELRRKAEVSGSQLSFSMCPTEENANSTREWRCADGRCSNYSRARDFDLLGYRYSLLSSIATGGLNNVMCYLPARDAEEFAKLPAAELGV